MTRTSPIACAALAAALAAAAHADTTLYGSLRLSVDYIDDQTLDQDYSDVRDNASRLGVKGSEELGGGLSAVYQYEFGVDAANTGNTKGRLAWVGLKGGFGALSLGRQWSPYYNAVGSLSDVWNSDDTAIGYYFLGQPHRISNALIYASPDWRGFSAQLALAPDSDALGDSGLTGQVRGDSPAEEDDVDLWDLALLYQSGPFKAGVAYRDNRSADYSLWGASASYAFADLNLIATYQQADLGSSEPWEADLTAEYRFGNNILRAGYARLDTDAPVADRGSETEFDIWKLGWQYNFSRRTRVFVEYADNEIATGGGFLPFGAEYDNLSVGMRHDF
ncbi:MAG TPA: porin [Candidatus Competibacteraceae bacterium]|nr:porin [Candidatus Competibacteraceae bacterium]